jgi:pyruvate dehydrogenase E1 component
MAVRRADMDPGDDELREWIDSIESVLDTEGPERAKALFRAVRDYLTDANVIVEDATLNTPYRNTIPLEQQPAYPGNIETRAAHREHQSLERHGHGAAWL